VSETIILVFVVKVGKLTSYAPLPKRAGIISYSVPLGILILFNQYVGNAILLSLNISLSKNLTKIKSLKRTSDFL